MNLSAKRVILWAAFAVSCVLALVDLLWIQGLFSWMILVPLVFVTGIANVAVSLWKHQGKAALLALVVTLVICGAYALILSWSLT